MSSLVHCTKKKEGLDRHSSMACVIGFHYDQAEPWQCQTQQGVTTSTSPIIIIFPMSSTTQWAQKWACIYGSGNHPFSGNCLYPVLNITVTLCLCVYVQMCF